MVFKHCGKWKGSAFLTVWSIAGCSRRTLLRDAMDGSSDNCFGLNFTRLFVEVCGKVFFYDARVIPPLSLQLELSCALFDGDVFFR